MKKETLIRLIKEVIKESEEPTIDPELQNLLDILQFDYNMFAHLVPDTIAEDTPLGQKHGVARVDASEFSVRIYFESDDAMERFVEILATLKIEYDFTAKKQRQSKNPKIYAHMGPRVIFHAPDDNDDEE